MSDEQCPAGRGVPVHVVCYEGYRAQEEPRRVTVAGRVVKVVSIIDQWGGESHRYFRVEGDDGRLYLLRCDEATGEWTLVSVRERDLPGT